MPVGHEIQGTQSMDLGDDWDDDNLFIEAADEFDKLIALSQAVPASYVIVHPTGQQNSEVKSFPHKMGTVNFESPKSSKLNFNSPSGNSGSKFQKSKSFNLDQIATNHDIRKNGACSNETDVISESTIKQSELYRTKCGENEILQKQIKNLTASLHESKTRQRHVMLEKDREKSMLKEEMEQKLVELRTELDRLNTELLFQKNHITSTEFRTKELKNVRLKEPESPNNPTGNAAWKMMDDMNSSFSRGKTSPLRGTTSPLGAKPSPLGTKPSPLVSDAKFKSPTGRFPQSPLVRSGDMEVKNHFGCVLNNIVGEKLLRFNSSGNSNSVVNKMGSDLVQLVTCPSFLTPKAQHLLYNILSSCNDMLSMEMSHLQQLSTSEDKGENTKRDHILSKSCFSILPSGQNYDLLEAKKLFDLEEGSELRRCVQLICVLCSLSSYALSVLLDVPLCDITKENAVVHSLEPVSSLSKDEISRSEKLDILNVLNQLVIEVASQNRTKPYNGLLLSIAHLMLTIFHQKISLPDTTLNLVSNVVKELILSRPAPAVLEVCVRMLAESTYSTQLQQYLCGQSETPSCRTSLVSNMDIVHSFTPQSCAIHVLCTYLELFQPSSSLIRAYLTWTLHLLAMRRTVSLRETNCRPCDCTSEVFHLCLVLAWSSVRKLCKDFTTERNLPKKHEIKACVELAYQALDKLKNDKHLQFLQREGIYEALLLRLKTSNLPISLSDKIQKSLTLDKDRSIPRYPSSSNENQTRTVICGDHLNEEFNDLDIS